MVWEESMCVILVRLYIMFLLHGMWILCFPDTSYCPAASNLASFPVTEACVGGKSELIHYTIIIADQMSSETKTGFGLACWDY